MQCSRSKTVANYLTYFPLRSEICFIPFQSGLDLVTYLAYRMWQKALSGTSETKVERILIA